jgi:anti-anti-sigma factor
MGDPLDKLQFQRRKPALPVFPPASEGGSLMNGAISNRMDTAIFPGGEFTGMVELTELTELVRGNEQALLARLIPLVRRQSVILDLGRIQRIDAAGIAALISLHANAYEAGHCFTVVNPTPHVAEILSLVGLDRILVSRNTVERSYSESCFELPAA